jgi:putative thioredoxin
MSAQPTDTHAAASILDVVDDAFDRAVVDESRVRPVVVDFWAPWCAPCRALGPILERVIGERGGELLLAKVDIDQCPRTAERFAVRSVPMVLGFRGGEVVASFVGAQPESAVRTFVDQLLPNEADRLVVEGLEFGAAGHRNAAEERLRRALELAPRHGGAWLALARLLAETGELAAALGALDEIDPLQPERGEADRLAAELRLRAGGAATDGDLEELAARAGAVPGDIDLRLELGGALAAAGRHEEALDALLEAIRLDPAHAEGAARRRFLDLLEVLGPEHELTSDYRRRLAGVLFR